jgi:predicted GNAT family N-acyltransferase
MAAALNYQFTNQIDLTALQRLFAQADWTASRSREQLARMLTHTRVCLGVWDGERLIGFARAITDDLFRAFVEDVIVDEAYRGQGIGAEIMHRLLERLAHVEEITLNCHDHLLPFYQRLGFERAGLNYMHIWKGQ